MVVFALSIVVPASAAGAHGTVDQASGSCYGQLFVDGWPDPPITEVAQTFVPTTDVLLGLDIQMAHFSGSALSIRAGGPDGAVIGGGSFEATESFDDWVHVDLDEPVSVTPGETYAFRFSNDAVYCHSTGYGPGALHACRETCSDSDQDLTFRTYTASAPPDTVIDSRPADPSTAPSAVFAFSGTDDVTPVGELTFECSLDGATFEPCESGDDVGPVVVGSHTFAVRAIDDEGQVDPTPAEYSWRVDPLPPSTPPGGPEATTTTTAPGRGLVAARAATPTKAQPSFTG